jgi:hypothetical protein
MHLLKAMLLSNPLKTFFSTEQTRSKSCFGSSSQSITNGWQYLRGLHETSVASCRKMIVMQISNHKKEVEYKAYRFLFIAIIKGIGW